MQRYVFFLYGVGCHLLFLGVFAYMAGFVEKAFPGRTQDSSTRWWREVSARQLRSI